MGSIMPPITQSLALSSTLVNTDSEPVVQIGYITALIVIVIVCLYVVTFFVKKDMKIVEFDENGEEITDDRKAGQILKENWHSLIPLGVLILGGVVCYRRRKR